MFLFHIHSPHTFWMIPLPLSSTLHPLWTRRCPPLAAATCQADRPSMPGVFSPPLYFQLWTKPLISGHGVWHTTACTQSGWHAKVLYDTVCKWWQWNREIELLIWTSCHIGKKKKKSKQKLFKLFLDFLRLLAKCIINWYRFLILYIERQLLKFMTSQCHTSSFFLPLHVVFIPPHFLFFESHESKPASQSSLPSWSHQLLYICILSITLGLPNL